MIELTDPNANPWQNGSIVFTPLRAWPTDTLQLLLMSAQVAARFHSPHPWMQDGMERFLQVRVVENRSGRKAALDYLDQFREPLVKAEETVQGRHPKTTGRESSTASSADNTLLNTNDELYLRGKSSFVLWMLRDMLGDTAMQSALASIGGRGQGSELLSAAAADNFKARPGVVLRRLGLSRPRAAGLPCGVGVRASAAERRHKNYLLTVTIENRGHAGAEVPVFMQTPSGEKSVRVLVKAGEKGVGRLEVPVAPDKITVNDGSVPEANTVNNAYDVPPPKNKFSLFPKWGKSGWLLS